MVAQQDDLVTDLHLLTGKAVTSANGPSEQLFFISDMPYIGEMLQPMLDVIRKHVDDTTTVEISHGRFPWKPLRIRLYHANIN